MKHRVGTKRIAKYAGVSTATVDRVLNERSGVSPATTRKVLDAISALNEANISKLSGNKRQGHFIFSVVIQSGAGFNERIQQKLTTLDYSRFDEEQIEIHESITTDLDSEAFAHRIRENSREKDGMIIACQETPLIRETINDLVRQHYPVVCISTDLPTTQRLAYVAMDQYRSGRVAGTLIGRFCGDHAGEVLFIVSGNFRCQQEREIGFREVLRHSFPNLSISESLQSADSSETSYKAMQAYLATGRTPLAIYNVSGGNKGIVQALTDLGPLERYPVYVCHDLTPNARLLLIEGKIDAVIDYDAEDMLVRAVKHLINFHNPDSYQINTDHLPIRICLADTV